MESENIPENAPAAIRALGKLGREEFAGPAFPFHWGCKLTPPCGGEAQSCNIFIFNKKFILNG